MSENYVMAGVELSEEGIKQGKNKDMGLNKVVVEYILVNPDVYV